MQPQQDINGSADVADQRGTIVCAQCGTPMLKGMRFCRTCGNRLGEGPEEYTETVRFPNARVTPQAGRLTTPFSPGAQAPLAQQTTCGISYRRRRGFRGMTWVWVMLAVFFAGGGILSGLRRPWRGRPPFTVSVNRSYFGVESFNNTDGGVTFDVVAPPGGPADKAGLVGGDVITTFDGRTVTKESQIMDLLREAPIGKTVEVIYLRDGEIKRTQLTTISNEERIRLEREFSSRPQGRGYFGFERDRMTRIKRPETNTFGVRINYVEPNRPADLFGIKPGDIITDFDNVPIRTPEEFLSRVRRATPYTTVNIALLRDGQRIVIPVKLGKG